MVEVRVESMSDFVANHLCFKPSPLRSLQVPARVCLPLPAVVRADRVEEQRGRKFLTENITFLGEKSTIE